MYLLLLFCIHTSMGWMASVCPVGSFLCHLLLYDTTILLTTNWTCIYGFVVLRKNSKPSILFILLSLNWFDQLVLTRDLGNDYLGT